MKVLPFTEESSLASTLLPCQGTIRSDLMHDKEVLNLELSCDDYIRVFNKLMGARTYCFEYQEDQPLRYLKTRICSRKVELKVL